MSHQRVCLFVLLLMWCTPWLHAALTMRDEARETAILEALRTRNPAAVAPFTEATAAGDREQFQQAVTLLEKVLVLAPDFNPAQRRLGCCLVELGRYTDGIAMLKTALANHRSEDNLIALAFYLLRPPSGTRVSAADRVDSLTLAREADRRLAGNDVINQTMLAQIWFLTEQMPEFNRTVDGMAKRFPREVSTHAFLAIRAVIQHKWFVVDRELRIAKKLGMPAAEAQQLADSVNLHFWLMLWRTVYSVVAVVALWIVGLVLLAVIGKTMSDATLRSIETADPNIGVSRQELTQRRRYRWLINIAGVYYYLSIPFVIFFVLLLSAGIILLILSTGYVPVKIVVILAIVALVTVYKSISSLFVRFNHEDPGRPLREDEAPGLWQMAREVAQQVGTRPIDEIRVLPGTELGVYENGSRKEIAEDRARRIMLLGIGTLNGFPQSAFRAVLAHEYGHFAHRDTAGGDLALRTNARLFEFAQAMIASGIAVWWNLGFQFVRLYWFIFRRLSFGATRLQEVLADRIAAMRYGTLAFENGLRHVVQTSLEFDARATQEIQDAVHNRRDLHNLYDLALEKSAALDQQIHDALTRGTSEDDTHPSPADRFRLVDRIHTEAIEQPGMMWELFSDRDRLVNEMHLLLDARVKEAFSITSDDTDATPPKDAVAETTSNGTEHDKPV